MASLGKVTNALVSGNNENNVSLANFNLDFALVRYDAPKEFNALGSALSLKRRNNAEEGPLHQFARRLGALFAQRIPSTPLLVKAFGQRASDIIQTPGVNPRGTSADGPFQEFVGADATSIWAAATSGVASIAVLLLACMLARKFDDAKYAIAIWSELVAERQREIRMAEVNGEIILETSMMAARQTITREELALFDASARSWLSSADEVKISEQKRLMLILKNIPTPVSVGSTTYDKVVSAWTGAMTGLEDLLKGMPQQISDSAILLALSAWHLYPDLLVLSKETKKVRFGDTLFIDSAVVTVGLQWADDQDWQGIRWSLALSHLCYYGDPIEIDSRGDGTRVTMTQLHMIAFGALLAGWQVPRTMVADSAKWFNALWTLLRKVKVQHPTPGYMSWIEILASAASNLTESSCEEQETCRMLLNLGRRRGKNFLGGFDGPLFGLPFLGLCNPHCLSALCEAPGVESSVDYIRSVASTLKLLPGDLVIAYNHEFVDQPCTVIATTVPHVCFAMKSTIGGSRKEAKIHARWVVNGPPEELGKKNEDLALANTDMGDEAALRRIRAEFLERKAEWVREMNARGEKAFEVGSSVEERVVWQRSSSENWLVWYKPPAMLRSSHVAMTCSASEYGVHDCACFDLNERLSGERSSFRLAVGSHEQVALYLRSDCSVSVTQFKQMWEKEGRRWLPPATGIAAFTEQILDTKHLTEYLYCISRERDDKLDTTIDGINSRKKGYVRSHEEDSTSSQYRHSEAIASQLHQDHKKSFTMALLKVRLPDTLIDSFNALYLATELYRHFPPVTIPVGIVSRPIHRSKWFQNHTGDFRRGKSGERTVASSWPLMSELFSCIAMFESGGLDIDPTYLTNVFALSSRNSIFVAGALLSDPSDSSSDKQVRRIIGNIDSPGISLLVSPKAPRMKAMTDDYRAIVHAEYDGKREDNFQSTSLHLAFTNWKTPLSSGEYGLIDDDVFILEAVISVHDRGAWIADIDILAASWGV